MNILVINCGSSSIKAEIIDTQSNTRKLTLFVERMNDQPLLHASDEALPLPLSPDSYANLLAKGFEYLVARDVCANLQGIGHRVIHGGLFNEAVLITEEVEKQIEALCPLAPLHNPIALKGIQLAKKYFPQLPHVAVSDTAFHQTMPRRAQLYALPTELMEKYGIRRYGFHGTSHQYVAQQAALYLQSDIRQLRLITCHLGSGCSVTAIEYGRSVETSMGMTPVEGLVMSTRSGDLDAGILLQLMEKENLDAEGLSKLLNNNSGLKGLTGSSDMRDIEKRAAQGDEHCRMALQVFTHRLRKYIGAYAAIMGGVDAIVFTAGIGENSATIRHRAAQRLEFLGAILDEDHNREAQVSASHPVAEISASHSRCKLLVVATDEQMAIAQQSASLIAEKNKVNPVKTIPIAISARHAHLTQEVVEQLFGPGHQLTPYKPLSQPGQYACEETISIVGPKNKIDNVRILGPVRTKSQVEISRTDEFFLGIDAPIRESGHTENSPGITLIGPKGKVILSEGLICAWRHIHMAPEDAEAFGVKDKDVVEVEVVNSERGLIFGQVIIRVSPNFKLEMHIDTDEANAAELNQGSAGALITTEAGGLLRKKQMK